MSDYLDLKNMMKGFAIAGLFGIGTAYFADSVMTPKKVYVPEVVDLNQDGIQDLVIEQGQGHKIPMYGIGGGEYVSASEMIERNPESTIDFKTIEAKLNE